MAASGKPDIKEKRPRHYASEIARMRSKDRRTAALDRAPIEWQGLIKTHVMTIFDRRKCRGNNG